MRRGFKSQCERKSAEIRKSLGLSSDDPLDANAYAKFLNISVWTEQEIEGVSIADIKQLNVDDSESWSAFTLRVENHYLVVVNSSQSTPRINSVLMHELSHINLGHDLTSAGLTEEGYFIPTTYDETDEEEADWLAGTLLLPRPALLKARRLRLTDQQIQDHFNVSQQMLTWRFRMTGVDYQMANARRRHFS